MCNNKNEFSIENVLPHIVKISEVLSGLCKKRVSASEKQLFGHTVPEENSAAII